MNINSGGSAISGYLADQCFTGGTAPSPRGPVPAPFDTGRYGTSFSYAVPASNGPHRLQLGFSESGGYATGQRVFKILVNGVAWLSHFDVYAEVGANTPVIKTIDCEAVAGYITLTFTGVVGNAFVNSIQLDEGLSVDEQILNELRIQTPLIQRLTNALTPPVGA